MRTPRQIWEEERDDPIYWSLWVAGIICVGLVVLIPRVVGILTEPASLADRVSGCSKPYKDPRCVRVEDVR